MRIDATAQSKTRLKMTIRKPKSPALGTDPWVMLEDEAGSGVSVAAFGPDSPAARADAARMMELWNTALAEDTEQG